MTLRPCFVIKDARDDGVLHNVTQRSNLSSNRGSGTYGSHDRGTFPTYHLGYLSGNLQHSTKRGCSTRECTELCGALRSSRRRRPDYALLVRQIRHWRTDISGGLFRYLIAVPLTAVAKCQLACSLQPFGSRFYWTGIWTRASAPPLPSLTYRHFL